MNTDLLNGALLGAATASTTPVGTLDLRIALRTYLLTDAPLVALVGTRVRPSKRAETDPLPGVTYKVVSNNRGHTLTAADGQSRARVQFDIWARDLASCVAAKERLATLLDGFIGTLSGLRIIWSKQDGEIDLHEFAADGSDRDLYHIAVDYLVRHAVTIPQFPPL